MSFVTKHYIEMVSFRDYVTSMLGLAPREGFPVRLKQFIFKGGLGGGG